jgi:hypothetical protein
MFGVGKHKVNSFRNPDREKVSCPTRERGREDPGPGLCLPVSGARSGGGLRWYYNGPVAKTYNARRLHNISNSHLLINSRGSNTSRKEVMTAARRQLRNNIYTIKYYIIQKY